MEMNTQSSENNVTEYCSFAEYVNTLPPDTIFRVWTRKSCFTPYEQEHKFSDQSIYVSDYCDHVIITNLIKLPNNDLLIEAKSWNDNYYTYYKLSEVDIARTPRDVE